MTVRVASSEKPKDVPQQLVLFEDGQLSLNGWPEKQGKDFVPNLEQLLRILLVAVFWVELTEPLRWDYITAQVPSLPSPASFLSLLQVFIPAASHKTHPMSQSLSQRLLSREPVRGNPLELPFMFEVCLYEQFEVRYEEEQTRFKIKERSRNSRWKGL